METSLNYLEKTIFEANNPAKTNTKTLDISFPEHHSETINSKTVYIQGTKSAQSKFTGKTDQEIWNAFREKDELAFIYIYTEYYQQLVRYGWQFSNDVDLIEDCIQDLFIYLRSKRSKVGKLNSRILVYLMFSFRRRIIDYKKKLQKKDKLCFNEEFEFGYELSFEQRLLNEEIIQDVSHKLNCAVDKLTRKQREIIYYLYYKNLSYNEIREIMQVSNVKTVRNILYRAIRSLRSAFIPESAC